MRGWNRGCDMVRCGCRCVIYLMVNGYRGVVKMCVVVGGFETGWDSAGKMAVRRRMAVGGKGNVDSAFYPSRIFQTSSVYLSRLQSRSDTS